MMSHHMLSGVTVPLITALDTDGRPSGTAADPLLRTMAAAQIDTLMLLGSNGEGGLLPADVTSDYLRAVTATWRELRPDGRVIINVSAPGTIDMLRRAEAALQAQPDALVVSPPSAFRHRADEIEQHLRAVTTFGHPFAIYNVPRYANPLPLEVFAALLDEPLLVGIKDSSADPATLTALVDACHDRTGVAVTQGDEQRLLAGLQAGARGIVPGVANVAPAICVALFRAWSKGDREDAERAQGVVTAMTAMHTIRPGVPTVKAVLHDRGLLPAATVAPPLIKTTSEELTMIKNLLAPYEEHLAGSADA